MVMWIVGIFAFLMIWTICSYFYLAYAMHPYYISKWYSRFLNWLALPPFFVIAIVVCWITMILEFFDKRKK